MKLSAGGFRDWYTLPVVCHLCGVKSRWVNRHNVVEGLSQIESEIKRVKEILSQEDEGQALESYLERGRETRGKLPYLTGQIKNS